jgi:hypothetical protein
VLALLLLTACDQPSPLTRPWGAADQRAYDPLEGGPVDLVAVAARTWGQEIEIRWDLLQPYPPGAFVVEVDLRYGAASPLLLRLPTVTSPPQGLTEVRLWQAPSLGQAALHVRLPPDWLTAATHVSLRLRDPVSDALLDALDDFLLDAPPPPRVGVRLIFWDILPALSPIQAERAWDGAHRGPRGVRHGLGNLLQAASAAHAPLTLIGLDDPATRSTLETVDRRDLVGGLRAAGRLTSISVPPSDVLALDDLPTLADTVADQTANPTAAPRLIGGDLATSRWGEPATASQLLTFLTARPWIDLGPAASSDPRPPAPAPFSDLRPAEQALLAAWAIAPMPRAGCPTLTLCVLGDRETLALFQPDGALRAIIVRRQERLHQLVGPAIQPEASLPAAPTWRPGRVVWGAADNPNLALTLIPGGIRLEGAADRSPISLALDPWRRFEPGWFSRYRLETSPTGPAWVWQGPTTRLTLHLKSSAPLTLATYRDGAARLGQIEDPDASIPPGHLLPFPLAQVPLPPGGIDLTLSVIPTAAGAPLR